MILVTVGMHSDGFVRLIEAMDLIAAQTDEEVVMQIGATFCQPCAARWFTFTTQVEMGKLCAEARVVVSHAGAGSILTALHHRKPLIVVPRLRRYGEVLDDHQLELAQALSQAGVLLLAHEAEELWSKLQEADGFVPPLRDHSALVTAVRRAVLSGADRRG